VRLRRTKKEFLLLHHLCEAQVMQQQEQRHASATRENARERKYNIRIQKALALEGDEWREE